MNDARDDFVRDKVIVLTGAAGGFGRLITELATDRGAHVVAGDIDPEGLATLEAHVIGRGGSIRTTTTDVTDLGQMQALVALAVTEFGRVDVMINNAGTMPLAFFSDHGAAADAWSRCIDINIKGVLNGMMAVYDQMMSQGQGQVINLSSIYGNHPVVGAAVYGATKAAVNTLSESFRVETQGVIKVTIVKPTGVPGTGLGAGVINPGAVVGIVGHNLGYLELFGRMADGDIDPADHDHQSAGYKVLDPDHIADAIIHVIDQPLGVSIGDITIRATGDGYIL